VIESQTAVSLANSAAAVYQTCGQIARGELAKPRLAAGWADQTSG